MMCELVQRLLHPTPAPVPQAFEAVPAEWAWVTTW